MLAQRPPMGWNSWNTFGGAINEQVVRDTADAIVEKGLKDAGYEYVVIDDCWSLRERSEEGRIVPNPEKFPSGMKALAEYVCRMGHRKIAYIHGDNTSVTRDRLSVFYRTMDSYMIKVPDNYILPSRYRDVALTAQRTRELLNLKDRPDCILFPDDFSAVGGINEILESGLRIPEDISVAGFDGIEISRFLSPKLTTLRQDSQTIGVRAADSLISLIESPKTTLIEKIVVPGELVEGESVRNMVLH